MKVAIVGAGSAGIFAAYRLANIEKVTVDLFEKGNSIETGQEMRLCLALEEPVRFLMASLPLPRNLVAGLQIF